MARAGPDDDSGSDDEHDVSAPTPGVAGVSDPERLVRETPLTHPRTFHLSGPERQYMARCPEHDDQEPSLSVKTV